MASISISDMQFYAFHGCFDEEQSIGTRFRVDLSFETDTSRAQQSDSIRDTVSYLDVYQVVKEQMSISSHLLEHVAERIATAVLSAFFAIDSVRVCVTKLNPPLGGQIGAVSVTLEKVR